MSSLTPGILQKLLQNVGNKDFKVAGEHRSALLQVISIVPSLEDDPWKTKGYYLRVSDSLHSAYVSVCNDDVELILSDKIQLGQFIYITRVDPSSPVPVLCGIKPIPKRRPCVGDPKDLISSDFLNAKKVERKVKSKRNVKKVVGNEDWIVRRLSFGNGRSGSMENKRLSLDSARKGWETSPSGKNGGKGASKVKPKDHLGRSDSKVPSISPLRAKNVIRSPNLLTKNTKKLSLEDLQKGSSISPLKNKNIVVSPKLPPIRNNTKSVKSSDSGSFPSLLNKVVLSSNKWSDSRIFWDLLPSSIHGLGKEVKSHRNTAFVSAVRSLEEASVFESVIQCISMFAELCDLSQRDSCEPLVEKFLDLHEHMTKADSVIRTLMNTRTSETKAVYDSQFCLIPGNKNASLWVQAAVETCLPKFSLYTKGDEKATTNGEKHHCIVLEKTPVKPKTENHSPKDKQTYCINNCSNKTELKVKESSISKKRLSTTKRTNAEHEFFPGSGLKPASILAENLLSSSRMWFFGYLEVSLRNGFGLKRGEDRSQIIGLLGHLKRVDQWLDGAFHYDARTNEKIESLRKKLYEFLLHHVDSAVSHR
ncbi:uncharacterized protein LOC142505549 [Primulina tabacum]|uniref:uncharacterized protein LOC142505549 n=1 Tax=Primulina tabacum TaxID=48773 RepID=UPI003F59E470